MSDNIICEVCGIKSKRMMNFNPEDWFYAEVSDEDNPDNSLIVAVCSEKCKNNFWKIGSGKMDLSKMNEVKLTPEELDLQSSVVLDDWVDIDSERWKDTDDNPMFTKKILRMGMGDFLFVDTLGRVWGKSKEENKFYPFHYEYGKKKYGYRIPGKAAN